MLETLDQPGNRSFIFLAALLIEITVIVTNFEVPAPTYFASEYASNFIPWLFVFSKEYWQIALWMIGAILFVLSPNYKTIFSQFSISLPGYPWLSWAIFQLITFVAFIGLTSIIFDKSANPSYLTVHWFLIWFGMAGATLMLWLLSFAPYKFWFNFIREHRTQFLSGALLGVISWMIIGMFSRFEAPLAQEQLWSFFSELTLRIVYFLLSFLYSDLVYQPLSHVVGTAAFPVEITHFCSGIEGILLITAFLAVYIWLFRKDLRFPQIFWLFPLGIIAVWLANSVRITLLIAVGTSYSPDVAQNGFHTNAGWIAFTFIALASIALSHRTHFFSAHHQEAVRPKEEISLPKALLLPLLAQIGLLMITSAVSGNFDWLYPIRIAIVTAVLFYYRNIYRNLIAAWTWNWVGPFVGLVVFAVWMLLEPSDQGSGTKLVQELDNLPSGLAVIWLFFRVIGSVITVPIVEELAFRGYLIRKLIAKDFENVRHGTFTWLSLIVSSLLFGLLHDRWLAGTLAGIGYALALYRRGQLGDAVLAHMTTNTLIALVVLVQQRWALWV